MPGRIVLSVLCIVRYVETSIFTERKIVTAFNAIIEYWILIIHERVIGYVLCYWIDFNSCLFDCYFEFNQKLNKKYL